VSPTHRAVVVATSSTQSRAGATQSHARRAGRPFTTHETRRAPHALTPPSATSASGHDVPHPRPSPKGSTELNAPAALNTHRVPDALTEDARPHTSALAAPGALNPPSVASAGAFGRQRFRPSIRANEGSAQSTKVSAIARASAPVRPSPRRDPRANTQPVARFPVTLIPLAARARTTLGTRPLAQPDAASAAAPTVPRTRQATRLTGDTGSASVSALAVALSVLLFALFGVTLATALHAHHRAQAAADFAALAAAIHALEGEGAACAQASSIAAANGATVSACALDGMNATVTVTVTPTFAPTAALGGSASASARAGPVTPLDLGV